MIRLRSLLTILTLLITTGIVGLVSAVPASATYVTPTATPKGEKVKEGASLARVLVKLPKNTGTALKIPYKTVGGSAKPGKDFKKTKGTLTIKKGTKSASIYIPLINDDVPEPTEEFTVKLTDGATYNLSAKTVTVTIKDDDEATVEQWTGDLTVHVTKNNVSGSVTQAEDWTMLLHLVLETDANHSSWYPTAASSWTAQGVKTSTDSSSECAAHPSRWEFDDGGTFTPEPSLANPGPSQSTYRLNNVYGKKSVDDSFIYPPVMEVGLTRVPSTEYTYWDYTHTCSEHVAADEETLGFQTTWRTSDPVNHPGTFPLTLTYKNGGATLTVDFTDTYHQSAGMTTTSRVTGTLTAS